MSKNEFGRLTSSRRLALTVGIAIALWASSAPLAVAARTVTADERGLYYTLPAQCGTNFNCTDWSGIGAYLGQFSFQSLFNNMPAAAIKLGHGRFQHFAAFDQTTEALFPYSQLVQYDASEVAAGRPSLFVSATYQGTSRPVVWNWYGNPSQPYVSNPGRAVNLNDERFVQFWVNQYIHPWLQKINRPNTMVALDNCSFAYGRYGVIDNSGNFVYGVTWNRPYAQNQAEFLASINNFFTRVHQVDPNIKMVCNTDAAEPSSEFVTSFQNADGAIIENMEYFYQGSDDWWRGAFYKQYVNAAWIGTTGKIGLMSWLVPSDSRMNAVLRRSYMHYLMVRGDNFFFAPHFSNATEVPPSNYSTMRNSLGLPVAPTVVAQEPMRPEGYALYSRRTSGGIAYLNWTGITKTITLPTGQQYVNSSGQPVTQITLGDMDGTYVLLAGSGANKYLSDLAWVSMTNGWGPAEKDMSNGEIAQGDGRTVSIRGTAYPKALGVHGNSKIDYDLTSLRSCSAFASDIGVDDETYGQGSVDFQIYADGVLLYDSGLMTGTTAAKKVNVSITGRNRLTLVVTDAADGNYYDHADWAGAKLVCQ